MRLPRYVIHVPADAAETLIETLNNSTDPDSDFELPGLGLNTVPELVETESGDLVVPDSFGQKLDADGDGAVDFYEVTLSVYPRLVDIFESALDAVGVEYARYHPDLKSDAAHDSPPEYESPAAFRESLERTVIQSETTA